ncbi:hypothetical protein Cgig2_002753 [Carnegiea gigantea]|uniref:Uncharacterized protein n=1 Tax=Carnegiea gigantea TaxID=171969 RepID=A0A9Q1H092_9CARY|nr:hypothetical protein Cgig2_002753 [Carnegiea gigantea]
MPPSNKGFTLNHDDSVPSMGSSSGTSHRQRDKAHNRGWHLGRKCYQRRTIGMFTNSTLSRVISSFIKGCKHFGSSYGAAATLVRTFEGQYTWPQSLVKKFIKDVGKNLRNLANKASKIPDDKDIACLYDNGQASLKARRSTPEIQKKSVQCLKTRTEGPKIKEEKTPTPCALKNIRPLELSESKKYTIYGLRKAAAMFYEKPTASTISTGSMYTPSDYSKLQYKLKSTQ